MTYTIDAYHQQAWSLVLLGYDKDLLAQYQDNMTDWDIGLAASSL